jgi:hypothetical protein
LPTLFGPKNVSLKMAKVLSPFWKRSSKSPVNAGDFQRSRTGNKIYSQPKTAGRRHQNSSVPRQVCIGHCLEKEQWN